MEEIQESEGRKSEGRESEIQEKDKLTEDVKTGTTGTGKPDSVEKRKEPRVLTTTSVKGVIGVYSPVHRIGKTRFSIRLGKQLSFSIRLGKQLSQKFPVLYLNLEGNAGGGYYFPEDPGQDIGDLLYYMRQVSQTGWIISCP